MNKSITWIIGLLLIISTVTAIETYERNKAINLQFTCTLNGAIPSDTTDYNITIADPDGDLVVINNETTPLGQGAYNYTFTFLQTGNYKIMSFCQDGTYSYSNAEYVTIKDFGNTDEKGLTAVTAFIFIAILVSLFIWRYLSKMFGSMMVMVSGLGVLFYIKEQGWVGWIIFACGFIMLIYALIMDKKTQRSRFR